MRAAVKRSIRSTAPNVSLEELIFRSGSLQGGHGRPVYLTVVVVGLVELDDHVSLFLVVADAIYVAVTMHVCTRKRVQ